ncbi:MAG TPA: hypothetical protein VGM27_26395 [Acidobacteriaceae bacterium]
MRRKLTSLEQLIDANIVYFVRLEGSLSLDQLRSALSRVQHKHPALRTLIREEPDGLYYEADCAPEIPLRVIPRASEYDYRRECRTELTTAFANGQPQLRVVWLKSKLEADLLLTTAHRICDGMSMLTVVRDLLRSLHTNEELIPYAPITPRDMIGDYQPPHPWKRTLAALLLNGLLRLIPSSRRPPENNEHFLEWGADRALLDALKQRCKAEGVSIHAALFVALDRALLSVFGKKKLPGWIDNPMDARRGRLAALKSDMVFFGGGSFKLRAGQAPDMEFWARARAVNEEIRGNIEQEMLDIPSRYHFCEMLRPVPPGKIQSIVRLGDALKVNGSWGCFALSNLGNVVVSDSKTPLQVKDLRLYMHSFNFRVLCLVTYTFNGEMRFYYVGDEKCLSLNQAAALKREFMAVLQHEVIRADDSAREFSHMLAAVAK